ncbi:auxin-responsive protein IAA29-like [Vigna umbellata]|uniref:auxin-responsive protein IAA29-like n=1 Tax=Vigna umbellata TaxID=87088 RepID=UPI001F5E491C|nr:auxin-responsive protein IAA29-like [Vigna umbellata]
MELQLGLALSTNQSQSLDLNSHAYDSIFHQNNFNKKRTFFQLFDHAPQTLHTDLVLPTLSLLPLTPSHHQDDHDQHSQCSSITKKDEEDAEDIVGWPPVNYWRKKLRVDNIGDRDEVVGKNNHVVWVDRCHGHGCLTTGRSNSSKSLYVKVKMEGVGIARKVELGMHQSFKTLTETLMDMFGTGHQESNSYELAYQDKEGDWLLAQDVPWRSFVGCAQRLKLMKKSNR